MKLAAHRECAAIPEPKWPDAYEANGKRACLWRAGVAVFATVLLSATLAVPVAAQQTIVIGDDKPSAVSGGPVRPDTADVVINNDVLDSLGSPGVYAPALPPSIPYTAPAQAGPAQAGPAQAGQVPSGTAYRLPGSGQLVISRPSTLLFPPTTFPRSRLAVPAPVGRTARTTTAPDTGKAQSRLLVPKPVAPTPPRVVPPEPAPAVATAVPREPVIEAPTESPTVSAPEPVAEPAAPPIAPVAEPTPPPVAPVAPKTEPIAPAAAAAPAAVAALPPEPAPAAEPPAAPSLTKELQSALPPAEPSPESEPATALPSAPATAAEPAPEPKAKPEPEPSQSAALTPARGPVGEMRLVFNEDSAELTVMAIGLLDGMAKELLSNSDARVQLLAYAKASEEGSSRARRLSLSRALAVRAYLIEKGIRSTRMDVRALGSGFKDGPPDRVDILPQNSAQ